MRKILFRSGVALATLGVVIAGAAAFSAFEAHVVNVTATINNATDISTNQLLLGNVFPQEVLHNPVTLSLSSSFLSAGNTNATEVNYVLKQKPTCGLPIPNTNPVQYSEIEQVQEDANGNFTCANVVGNNAGPGQYVLLPLLCPYLSKTSPTPGDTSIPSFHGTTTLAAWTDAVSVANEAKGHLSKSGVTSTTWDIDLHTPCFKGECAQDWASFVHTANASVTDPTLYEADPLLKGQAMGCDLWYEVSGIGPNVVKVGAKDLAADFTDVAAHPTKWFMYNDSSDTIDNSLGSFVAGPPTPPYGTGSVQFTLGANPLDRKNIATYQFSGTPLSSITQMSFGVYSHSGVSGPNESPFLNFNVDFNGSDTWQKRLVYVPSANGAVSQDTWNSYDVINGGNALWTWSGYAGNGNKWPDNNVNEYRTWNDVKTSFPGVRVRVTDSWLGIRVGEPGPTGYTGNVDFFSIGTGGTPTVYNFDN